jgi:hypothetical protein
MHLKIQPLSEFLKCGHIALAIFAETEIRSDKHFFGLESVNNDCLDKSPAGEIGKFLVERSNQDSLDT